MRLALDGIRFERGLCAKYAGDAELATTLGYLVVHLVKPIRFNRRVGRRDVHAISDHVGFGEAEDLHSCLRRLVQETEYTLDVLIEIGGLTDLCETNAKDFHGLLPFESTGRSMRSLHTINPISPYSLFRAPHDGPETVEQPEAQRA